MSLSFLVYAIQVVLGIGLVIFVHELGHFLAARWCGARVEVFSLGFGPRLFGWQRGETMFQVAAVPLGGFVKVAGEYHDGTGPEEDGTLSSLNVGQRFLYYSGGVIMNVLFALVVMPLVMFAGYQSQDAVIGSPDPGYPAWEAGVPAGSRVLEVNGEEVLDFQHLVTAIAVNGKDDVTLVVEPPGDGGPSTFTLTPKFDENSGVYRIGVPLGMDPSRALTIEPDSPAAAAGIVAGDRLVRVLGQPEGLPLQRQLARALTSEEPAEFVVEGPDGAERTVRVEPRVVVKENLRIGVGALANRVVSVRSSGAMGGFPAAFGIQPDDELLSIAGVDAFGYREVEDALGALAPGATLDAIVLRDGERVELSAPLPAGVPPVAFLADVGLGLNTDTNRVSVEEGSAAAVAGLSDGDRILTIDGAAVSGWQELLEAIQRGTERNRPLEVVVEHAGPGVPFAERVAGGPSENMRVTLSGRPVELPLFGLNVRAATITLEADTFGSALGLGTRLTGRMLMDIAKQLKKMIFSDEISAKNTGGIITISAIAYDTASQGLSKLFFFLAVLSINLAIINLLPIPILDGGHLLFLLIEAIKGSPVSERTFGYSQVVGLVMIMSLMVYVTYQDIVRWFLRS